MKCGRLSQMGQGGLGQVVRLTSMDEKREWEVGIGNTGKGMEIRTAGGQNKAYARDNVLQVVINV